MLMHRKGGQKKMVRKNKKENRNMEIRYTTRIQVKLDSTHNLYRELPPKKSLMAVSPMLYPLRSKIRIWN